jgi:hypothetical protein
MSDAFTILSGQYLIVSRSILIFWRKVGIPICFTSPITMTCARLVAAIQLMSQFRLIGFRRFSTASCLRDARKHTTSCILYLAQCACVYVERCTMSHIQQALSRSHMYHHPTHALSCSIQYKPSHKKIHHVLHFPTQIQRSVHSRSNHGRQHPHRSPQIPRRKNHQTIFNLTLE